MPAHASQPAVHRDIILPQMKAGELDLLKLLLADSHHYLEFGMGGSTLLAAGLVKTSITAVDSSLGWMEHVRDCLERARPAPRVTLVHAYISELAEWGMPKDAEMTAAFRNYHSAVWAIEQARHADTVMVDGRFRVACCLQALLHCRSDTTLLVHDYGSREKYHVIERFCRRIALRDDLGVFIRRSHFDTDAARDMLNAFAANPA